MADFKINVIIDPAGAQSGGKKVENQMNKIGGAATRVGALIRRALAFAGLTVGIGELVRLADTFTNIQNRLRTVTSGTAELTAATDALFAISNRTRSSFESTAEVYARVGLATQEMGISQKQTLQFTESLNQAVLLSGASASEASAGLIQLSQGLASGALRGDELNSVLEQLPVVADVIADGLGVTRGKLREMGSEGKITADIVLNAFAKAREELEGRFAEAVPTIGQAFTVLRNNVIGFIGSMDQATGISSVLAQAIITVANNVETMARLFGAAAIVIGVNFAQKGIVAATVAMRALTVAMLANPLGAMIKLITVGISLLITFGDKIGVSASGLAHLGDVAAVAWERITSGIAAVVNFFGSVFPKIGSVGAAVFGDLDLSFSGLVKMFAAGVDQTVGFFSGGWAAIKAGAVNAAAGIGNIFTSLFNKVATKFAGFINTIIGGLNKISEFAGLGTIGEVTARQLDTDYAGAGETAAEAFTRGMSGSTAATDAVNGFFDDVERKAQDRVADQKLIDLANSNDPLGGTNTPAATGVGTGGSGGTKKVNEDLERQKDLLKEIAGAQGELALKGNDLKFLYDQGAISAQQFTEAMRDLNVEVTALDNSFSGGLANGFATIAARANDLGSEVSNVVVGAFDDLTAGVVEFAKTGKFSIKDFFGNLAAEMLKIATNQLFSNLLGGLFGGGGGGGGLFGGLFGGIPGFATGGSFKVGGSGQTDSQLVAFRATPGERVDVSTPDQQRRNMGGGETTVVQAPAPNVQVNITPSDITGALSGSEGDTFLVQGIEKNAKSIKALLGQ